MAARRSNGTRGRATRPPERREMIMAAAAELFHSRGFRATRLEDIGAAVGMTGPAVYRHFESKEALLTELLERYTQRATREMKTAQDVNTPREAIAALLRAAVAQAVDDGDLVATARSEYAHLPEDAKRRVERRHRAIIERWVVAIRALRKDVDAEEARVMAVGVSAMVAAGAQQKIGKDKLVERLTRMAMAALTAR